MLFIKIRYYKNISLLSWEGFMNKKKEEEKLKHFFKTLKNSFS